MIKDNLSEKNNEISPLDVLYEDNHIIIFNKSPSEIVQGDKTGDIPLLDKIKTFLKKKYNKPGSVFLGTVHRLDRPASGAVIYARTSKALIRLNELIKKREIKKTYWAVVKNKPPKPESLLSDYLLKNQKQNKSYIVSKERKGALKAELSYKIISQSRDYYLMEVDLITGRHHQIRVQLAGLGSPIKGDIKYGFARTNQDASIHLHARKVEFIHPVKKEKLRIIAPVPDDNLWKFFQESVSKPENEKQ